MKNLGNTCFMNSALQCLIALEPLSKYILTEKFLNDLNIINIIGSQGVVASSYFNLLLDYNNSNSYINPSNLKNSMKKVSKQFVGYSQQDSQEFLSYLIDTLHEDTNLILKKPYLEIKDYKNEKIDDYANYCWNIFIQRNKSEVLNYLYGQFKTTIDCSNCNYVSYNFDPFNVLSLALPKSNNYNNYNKLDKLEFYFIPFHYNSNKNYSIYIDQSKNFDFVLRNICIKNDIKIEELKILNIKKNKITRMVEDYTDISVKEIINYPEYFFVQRVWNSDLMGIEMNSRNGKIYSIFYNFDNDLDNLINITKVMFIPYNYSVYELYLLIYITIRKNLTSILKLDNEEGFNLKNYDKEFKNNFWNNDNFFKIKINNQTINENEKNLNLKEINKIQIIISSKKPFNNLKLRSVVKEELKINNNIINQNNEEELTIYNLINKMKKYEKLDEENKWYCNQCKTRNRAQMKVELYKLPKVLIIHLKRFKTSSKYFQKNNEFVDYPIENLDLNDIIVKKENNISYKYDLFGTVNHMGGLSSGHYISKTKSWNSNKWYEHNDEYVKEINPQSAIQSSSYILFYKRRDI